MKHCSKVIGRAAAFIIPPFAVPRKQSYLSSNAYKNVILLSITCNSAKAAVNPGTAATLASSYTVPLIVVNGSS